jgi:Mg-chelatase subunit ChlI
MDKDSNTKKVRVTSAHKALANPKEVKVKKHREAAEPELERDDEQEHNKKDSHKKKKRQAEEEEEEAEEDEEDEDQEEDDDDDDDEDDDDEDDDDDDEDNVSFNTEDILENDPLYFVLSKIFITSGDEDAPKHNIADLMQKIVERLDVLIDISKKASKSGSSGSGHRIA